MAAETIKAGERALPQRVTGYPEVRGSEYGESYVNPLSMHRAALQGTLFVSRNTTQGTGIAQTANTTSDTTKPFITGTNPSTSNKNIHLIYLRLRPTAVSSGETIQTIDIVTCDGVAWSSAGTDFNQIASGIATAGYHGVNSGLNLASVHSVLRVGVPVTVLGANPRNVVRFVPRQTTIPVVGDSYMMRFGSMGSDFWPGVSVVEPVSTTINNYVRDFTPLIIAPGTSYMIIPWAAGILGAMSWEFELCWMEF